MISRLNEWVISQDPSILLGNCVSWLVGKNLSSKPQSLHCCRCYTHAMARIHLSIRLNKIYGLGGMGVI